MSISRTAFSVFGSSSWPFHTERRTQIIESQRRDIEEMKALIRDLLTDVSASHNNQPFESLRAEAQALEPRLALGRLRRSPDSIETSVHLVYRIEQQAVDPCGQPSPLDRALLLIGRRHEADRQ